MGRPLAVPAEQEAAGHPQVAEQRAAALEAEDEILAAPVDRLDTFALELEGDRARVSRRDEPGVEHVDSLETAPGEHGRECCANGVDLGQLGHAASVVGDLRVALSATR